MLKEHHLGADDRKGTDFLHLEAFHYVAHNGQADSLRGVDRRRFRHSGQYACEHHEHKNHRQQFLHLSSFPFQVFYIWL